MAAERLIARSAAPSLRARYPVVIAGGVALSLLHAGPLRWLEAGDFTPDLFALFALYLGLFASRQGRYTPCLVLGLVRDFFSLGLLGSYAVLFSLLHKFASHARMKLDPEKPVNVLLIAFVGIFLTQVGYHAMLALSGDGIGWSRALVRCAATGASSALFAVPLFTLAHYGLARVGVRRLPGGFWNV